MDNDEESQPLLRKDQTGQNRMDSYNAGRPLVISKISDVKDGNRDATNYPINALNSWWTVCNLQGTVFKRWTVWVVMLRLSMISLAVGFMVMYLLDQPNRLKIAKFSKLGSFLSVFVGLLLGFFMSSSMARWYACVDGFLIVMDSIRNLQMQLLALGVDEDKIHDILRYGILSVNMLDMELRVEALPVESKTAHMEEYWGEFKERMHSVTGAEKEYCYMETEEADALSKVDDPAAVIWIWVAVIIARMAQDGDIPPMPSPTYGRIAQYSQDAHSGIRQVKQSISIKPPYIYAQLLAWLVHTNNIVNAVSFGLTWGAAMGTMVKWHTQGQQTPHEATFGEVVRDGQNMIVACFVSCFGPFIYQALLEVAIAIASPFSSTEGALPVRKFLTALELDLTHSRNMKHALPKQWAQPCFKKPAAS